LYPAHGKKAGKGEREEDEKLIKVLKKHGKDCQELLRWLKVERPTVPQMDPDFVSCRWGKQG
jgi:hypothetical protein